MNLTKFQQRFNESLKNGNVKQSELAKAVGVSKQCVTDYKMGRSVPSIDTFYLICRYLDESADYLLGLDE